MAEKISIEIIYLELNLPWFSCSIASPELRLYGNLNFAATYVEARDRRRTINKLDPLKYVLYLSIYSSFYRRN